VVVAVVAVRMVEATLDDVIDMVAVGNRLMAAVGTMDVMIVVGEVVDGSASVGVFGGDLQRMLFDGSVLILMMEVSIVNEIDVIPVLDLGVAAACVVVVVVGFVAGGWVSHGMRTLIRHPLDDQRKHRIRHDGNPFADRHAGLIRRDSVP
jgi:hypothetical protein